MTGQEKTARAILTLPPWRKWFHGAVAASILGLGCLAQVPFEEGPARPLLVALSVLCCVGLSSGLVHCLSSKRSDLRALGVLVGLSGIYLAAQLDGWALSSRRRLAAALTESLSLSLFGLPWVAMLMALSVLALIVIQSEHLKQALVGAQRKKPSLFVALTAGVSGLLWLRALMGYASGSPNLLP